MTELFLKLVNMSLSAGWLVLAVLVLRLALKGLRRWITVPRWIAVLLWGLVAVRLVCPFTVESALSLIPSAQVLPDRVLAGPSFDIQTGISAVDQGVNRYLGDRYFEGVTMPAGNGWSWMTVLALIWAAGMAVMLLYAAVSYVRLRRRIGTAVRFRDNIFESERAATPFVLGVIRPRIYLPFGLDGTTRDHVIAHEHAHISRKDHWWKPLGFVLLAVYWFHPLMWVAYVLLCRDIELACDEKVIRTLDRRARADYSQALLSCSAGRCQIAACPLAFGEVGVKERVRSVLRYRKPAFWAVAAALVVCAGVAAAFLTDPVTGAQEIRVNGMVYVRSGEGIQALPEGSTQLGTLVSVVHRTDSHPEEDFTGTNLDPKYAGCPIYQSRADIRVIFLEDYGGAYLPFVCEGAAAGTWQLCDFSLDGDGLQWDSVRETVLWQFPSLTFRCTPEKVTVTENGEERELFFGMPVWNVFFSDLNGDGRPELCATVSIGSGVIDERVYVYDIADSRLYELSDRMEYDYVLSLEDGKLMVTRYPYMDHDHPDASGQLMLTADGRLGISSSAVSAQGETIPSGTLIRTYVFPEGDGTTLALYDSGEFTFTFSYLSSYWGYGSYTAEGNRLILRTADGDFTYVFDMEGETLVFDGEASSEQVWFSGLYDGAVME